MGILDRLRGAVTPDEGLDRLQAAVNQETARLWVPLYSNEELISDVFVQRGPNVVEMATGGEFTLELSGGYMAFVSGKAAGKKTTSQTIKITAMLQAMMLRDGASDLAVRPAEPGDTLLRFVGPGRITDEPVSPDLDMGITPGLATALQDRREQQESRMRRTDPNHPGTVVWLGRGASPLASIASRRGGSTNLDSYMTTANFGVLGVAEPKLDIDEDAGNSLVLLAPLMIWYHAGDQ